MSSASNHHIPHVTVRTLIEVGAVVGVFLLAIGCMACALDQRPGESEDHNRGYCFSSRCALLSRWCKRRIRMLMQRGESEDDDDDDDDEESYITDEESGRPAPHVFDTLNEMVFFLAPDGDDDGDEAPAHEATPIRRNRDSHGGNDDNNGLTTTTTTTMNKIFPDLLAKPSSGTASGSDVRGEGGEATSAAADSTAAAAVAATDGEVGNDGSANAVTDAHADTAEDGEVSNDLSEPLL
eukprot:jgi/Psemu1/323335/estExt_fgenesh1_pg.C_670035